MADPTLTEVDFNPFAPKPFDTSNLTPVEGNPFATAQPSTQPEEKKSYEAGEVPAEAARNFLPSLAKNLEGMWEGAKYLATEPHKALPQLASHAISMMDALPGAPDSEIRQAFLNHIAEKQGPEAAAQRAKSVESWDKSKAALEEKYGGWEEIKRTAAEDPAGLLMDLSTVLAGGALAAGKLPGVAKALDTAATLTDPVSAALGVAKNVGEPLLTGKLGVQSGVGSAPLREAARAGFEGGDTAKNFWRAYTEGVPAGEIVGLAEKNIADIKRRAQDTYSVRKNDPRHGWSNDPNTLDFAPIEQAWKDTVNSLTTKSGKRTVGDAEWNQIQKVGDVVAEWEKDIKSGAIAGTADDFDGLKRRIRAIYPDGEAPQLRRVVTKMAGEVDREIKRQTPGYHTAMRDYSEAMDALDEMQSAFSLGDKASIQTKMSKLQSVMRNNANTQYGHRTDTLHDIEQQGGRELSPFLAGSALNSWEPRGLARIGLSAAPETAAATMLFGPLAGAVTAGTSAAASVPKITGGAYHFAGRAAGAPDALARFLPKGARPRPGFFWNTFGRNPRLGARLAGELEPEEERKTGGYFRARRPK